MNPNDVETMKMALVGYEQQRAEIDAAITDLRRKLRGHLAEPKPEPQIHRKNRMSEEGRASIAAAQKKRWEDYRRKLAGLAAA